MWTGLVRQTSPPWPRGHDQHKQRGRGGSPPCDDDEVAQVHAVALGEHGGNRSPLERVVAQNQQGREAGQDDEDREDREPTQGTSHAADASDSTKCPQEGRSGRVELPDPAAHWRCLLRGRAAPAGPVTRPQHDSPRTGGQRRRPRARPRGATARRHPLPRCCGWVRRRSRLLSIRAQRMRRSRHAIGLRGMENASSREPRGAHWSRPPRVSGRISGHSTETPERCTDLGIFRPRRNREGRRRSPKKVT
jgi:hypothetical protein